MPNPDPRLDCEKNLHMVTFGVTLGQSGLIYNNKDLPAVNADPYNKHNYPQWSDPNASTSDRRVQIDDLWHATINTRGMLLNAETPAEVADKFSSALETIMSGKASGSALAANSGSLSTDSLIYKASFRGNSGELAAYKGSDVAKDTSPEWQASKQLAKITLNDRVILTTEDVLESDGNPELSDAPTAFRWESLPDPDNYGLSEAKVDYIRGDQSQERANGGTFRDRGDNILGDIVHSTPVYVGAPDRARYPAPTQWKDLLHPDAVMLENVAGAYSDPTKGTGFAQQYADREHMIYVGANDGMLHGFDADTGEEKLAYIPGVVLPNLAKLTEPDYGHQYYVDGSPAVGDVVFDGAWHTVLVGGERNGGRSIFALDVTDPSGSVTPEDRFSESNADNIVLWEYTDKDLGKTYGKPSIVRLHDGKWAAMFGNGYNSDNGRPVLYLVNISNGHLIRKMCPRAAPGQYNGNAFGWYKNHPDGLSEPFPVDLDGDFITDYAYAGDLLGNLWKFDLRSITPQSSDECDNKNITKLFTATYPDDSNKTQPIITQPQVGVHPYGKDYGVMVYFGTGKYLEKSDATLDPSIHNSMYGIWDSDVFTADPTKAGPGHHPTISRDDLTQQSVIQDVAADGATYRVVSDNPVAYQRASNKGPPPPRRRDEDDDDEDEDEGGRPPPKDDGTLGWVLDLSGGGLIDSNPRLQGSTVSFSTKIPSVQTCKAGGSGYFMTVDAATGGRTDFPAFDLNGDDQFNAQDTVNVDDKRVSVSGIKIDNGAPGAATHLIDRTNEDDQVMIPTSQGDVVKIAINNGRQPDRRVSWHEIRR
jgi:type IV pilus assembly protein PilY1